MRRELKHPRPPTKSGGVRFEKRLFLDLAERILPGDVAVFDLEFGVPLSCGMSLKTIIFISSESLDAVREGGGHRRLGYITPPGTDAPSNAPIREYMMGHANLVGRRLPNNLFTDNAGTEVGSDLVIPQKNSGRNGSCTITKSCSYRRKKTDRQFRRTAYVGSIGMIPPLGSDTRHRPLRKPAYKVATGAALRSWRRTPEHLKVELHQLDGELYERHSLHSEQREKHGN